MEAIDLNDVRAAIRDALEKSGRKARAVSMSAGLGPDTLGKFLKGEIEQMKAGNLASVQRELGLIPLQGSLAQFAPDRTIISSTVRPADVEPPQRHSMRLDVPVRGVVVGGKDGFFSFNGGIADYVRRPERAQFMRNLYALFVTNDSMFPRFGPGELIYVNPDQPPAVGDDVVVELVPEEEDQAGQAFIKRLKRRSASQVVVEQFNPQGDIVYDTARVKIIHKVLTLKDLMGL